SPPARPPGRNSARPPPRAAPRCATAPSASSAQPSPRRAARGWPSGRARSRSRCSSSSARPSLHSTGASSQKSPRPYASLCDGHTESHSFEIAFIRLGQVPLPDEAGEYPAQVVVVTPDLLRDRRPLPRLPGGELHDLTLGLAQLPRGGRGAV